MLGQLQSSSDQLTSEFPNKLPRSLKRTHRLMNIFEGEKYQITSQKKQFVPLSSPPKISHTPKTFLKQLPLALWAYCLQYLKEDPKSLVQFSQATHDQSCVLEMVKNNHWSQIKWLEGPKVNTLLNYFWNMNFEEGLNLALIMYQNHHQASPTISNYTKNQQSINLSKIIARLNKLYLHFHHIENPDVKSLAADFLENIYLNTTFNTDLTFPKKLQLFQENLKDEAEYQLFMLNQHLIDNNSCTLDFDVKNEFNLDLDLNAENLTWPERFMRFEMWKVKTKNFTFFNNIDCKKLLFELHHCDLGIPKYVYEKISLHFFYQQPYLENQKISLKIQDDILGRSDAQIKDFAVALDLNIQAKQYKRAIELSKLSFLGPIIGVVNEGFIIDPYKIFGESYKVTSPQHLGNMAFCYFISDDYQNLMIIINNMPFTLNRTRTILSHQDKLFFNQLALVILPEKGLEVIETASQMTYKELSRPEQQNILFFSLCKKIYNAFQYKIKNRNSLLKTEVRFS